MWQELIPGVWKGDPEAKVRIEIPFLPDRALSPNARVYWAERYRAAEVLKDAAYYLAREKGIPPEFKRAIVRITYVVSTNRVRDPDNWLIMAKPAIDGLVAAGVFPDDSEGVLRYCPVVFRVTKESPKMVIEVKEGWD